MRNLLYSIYLYKVKYIAIFALIVSFYSNAQNSFYNFYEKNNVPQNDFDSLIENYDLDYSKNKNWAFRSDYDDMEKLLPKNLKDTFTENFQVNVFYIHPTTLYSSNRWNSDTSSFGKDPIIKLGLENQASCFAGIANIYAPNYRQMHIYSYVDTVNGYKAYDLAFKDVLQSFKYFLNNINNNNFFILVGHSQGTNHAVRLINEFIQYDNDISSKLLLSYLIGMDVKKKFSFIPPCQSSDDLFCFLSWRTFLKGVYPENWDYGNHVSSINPINWTIDSNISYHDEHEGILLPNRFLLFKNTLSASNHKGLLWLERPKNILLRLYPSRNYHPGDYNLYWKNIRDNFINRMNQL